MHNYYPTREEAWKLLNEFNNNTSLINHALAVESVMRYMARKANDNEEKWGIIGLIHDLDYQQFPDQHCKKTKEILESQRWPQDYIRAVISHGWGHCNEVKPETLLEKTLYAIDELVGFVTACVLVRPTKSLEGLEVKSVKKKWKQKTFAAGANREVIEKGANMLGIDLDELIFNVIEGMKSVALKIGL
ncbi:MAG: HD domain-containing protein [Desulfobacterales bacterium]|nr:HD domain-containing protein [Desulfobacterales bacterium]MBF0395950.1 HD domain-containing protein [Desulfobacterales bacterium]